MPQVVLDTNIVLAYVRQKTQITQVFEAAYPPTSFDYVISIVTRAEMLVLADRNSWGQAKRALLNNLLSNYLEVSIDNDLLVNAYVGIDVFSAVPSQRNNSSRKMGKNDLWIAATANAYQSALATCDGDFDHLGQPFFPLTKLYEDPQNPGQYLSITS